MKIILKYLRDNSEFCNLMLIIPLKLGHRGKCGKPEDLRQEQGFNYQVAQIPKSKR